MKLVDVVRGDRLQPGNLLLAFFAYEKVREALLRLEIVLDRHSPADLAARNDEAVLGLEHREQAAFDGESREADRVVRGRSPAERAGDVNVDVARAVNAHC